MIAGATALDRDRLALDEVLALWSDTNLDMNTRLNRLRSGPLAADRVHPNGGRNTLAGADGLDAYFVAARDAVKLEPGEPLLSLSQRTGLRRGRRDRNPTGRA